MLAAACASRRAARADGRDHARHAAVTCTLIARARVTAPQRAGLDHVGGDAAQHLALTFIAPTFRNRRWSSPRSSRPRSRCSMDAASSSQLWFVVLCWLSAMLHRHRRRDAYPGERRGHLARSGISPGRHRLRPTRIMLLLLWTPRAAPGIAADTADQAAAGDDDRRCAPARKRDAAAGGDRRARALVTQLRDAQQLAVIGRLVGGVAQDFNNH